MFNFEQNLGAKTGILVSKTPGYGPEGTCFQKK